MKVSLSWLKELVSLPETIKFAAIAEKLTMAGLEVEGMTHVGKSLSSVILAEVLGKRPHPHAEKLSLVDVFDGHSVTQVVCGARNVPAPGSNKYVLWAKPGAMLPSGITLSTKEVRGIASPGMLCSATELGLSEQAEGLLLLDKEEGLQPGDDFAKKAGLPDIIFEINITPNRADCLGHVGVAREVAALFYHQGATLNSLAVGLPPTGLAITKDLVTVHIEDTIACPRYRAFVLQDVQVKPSPFQTQILLTRLGLRPINNIVDATQLAMLKWGNPLHAFDLEKVKSLGSSVIVTKKASTTHIELLDGSVRELSKEDVVIAAGADPIALAGIMGGKNSQVDEHTKQVLLETAYFSPDVIRKTAKSQKLQTDASYRFERGVDPNEGLVWAGNDCAKMILHSAGGQLAKDPLDLYQVPIPPVEVELLPSKTQALLGTTISEQEQEQILTLLGMKVTKRFSQEKKLGNSPSGEVVFAVQVPTYRPDISKPIDLVEEIGRLWGYEHIEGTLPKMSMPVNFASIQKAQAKKVAVEKTQDVCVSLGLTEIQTLPFSSVKRLDVLQLPKDHPQANPILIQNPLREEASVLRTQLLLGLLEAVSYNLSHGQKRVRLFEVAEVFLTGTKDMPLEEQHVAGVLVGTKEDWMKTQKEADFYELKGMVEILVSTLYGVPVATAPTTEQEAPWFHPGVSAKLFSREQPSMIYGEFGEIHPDVRKALGIEVPAFAFELRVPETLPKQPAFEPWARFPAVERDLSFFVEEHIPAGDVVSFLYGAKQPLLTHVTILEDYREPGRVPKGKKGLLLSLTYQSKEKTLRDEEVQAAHDACVAHLKQHISIEPR